MEDFFFVQEQLLLVKKQELQLELFLQELKQGEVEHFKAILLFQSNEVVELIQQV